MRSHTFIYNINNYTDDDIAMCAALYKDDTKCRYTCIGFKKDHRTDALSIQGYINYTDEVDLNIMKKRLSPFHVECHNTKNNTCDYISCMEDGDYYEMGIRPKRSRNTVYDNIKNDLLSGIPLENISKKYPNQWRFHKKSFEEFIKMHNNR